MSEVGSKLRPGFGALHHSYQKLWDFMLNKDSLTAHLLHTEKKKTQLFLICQIAPRAASVKEQPSGLMQSYSKGSAVCCCLLLHPHTTPTCPNPSILTQQTRTHACITVMLISREQQANVGQWINTLLIPDPAHRLHVRLFFPSIYFCSFLWLFRASASSPPPPCCVRECREAMLGRLSHTCLPLSKHLRAFYTGTHCAVTVHFL